MNEAFIILMQYEFTKGRVPLVNQSIQKRQHELNVE